ncbi:PaaI family thioesterase [Glycocaulis sp.]|uniref:PaaI family thioesterase n=1 Tax=Glycocaulis sp. TaxID=1969725 RepID=UPI003D24BE7F
MSKPPPFFSENHAPPAAKLLGWRYEGGDAAEGAIEVSFEAREDFLNPAGTIQGGFLAAMLDDTMGPAIVLASDGKSYAPTINLNVSFLRPVLPGRVRVKARIVQMGKTVAYLAGELFDSNGQLAATATASARVIANPMGKA